MFASIRDQANRGSECQTLQRKRARRMNTEREPKLQMKKENDEGTGWSGMQKWIGRRRVMWVLLMLFVGRGFVVGWWWLWMGADLSPTHWLHNSTTPFISIQLEWHQQWFHMIYTRYGTTITDFPVYSSTESYVSAGDLYWHVIDQLTISSYINYWNWSLSCNHLGPHWRQACMQVRQFCQPSRQYVGPPYSTIAILMFFCENLRWAQYSRYTLQDLIVPRPIFRSCWGNWLTQQMAKHWQLVVVHP